MSPWLVDNRVFPFIMPVREVIPLQRVGSEAPPSERSTPHQQIGSLDEQTTPTSNASLAAHRKRRMANQLRRRDELMHNEERFCIPRTVLLFFFLLATFLGILVSQWFLTTTSASETFTGVTHVSIEMEECDLVVAPFTTMTGNTTLVYRLGRSPQDVANVTFVDGQHLTAKLLRSEHGRSIGGNASYEVECTATLLVDTSTPLTALNITATSSRRSHVTIYDLTLTDEFLVSGDVLDLMLLNVQAGTMDVRIGNGVAIMNSVAATEAQGIKVELARGDILIGVANATEASLTWNQPCGHVCLPNGMFANDTHCTMPTEQSCSAEFGCLDGNATDATINSYFLAPIQACELRNCTGNVATIPLSGPGPAVTLDLTSHDGSVTVYDVECQGHAAQLLADTPTCQTVTNTSYPEGGTPQALNPPQLSDELLFDMYSSTSNLSEFDDVLFSINFPSFQQDTLWLASNKRVYLAFDTAYLSTASASLLRPTFRNIRAHLSPGFCPYTMTPSDTQLGVLSDLLRAAGTTIAQVANSSAVPHSAASRPTPVTTHVGQRVARSTVMSFTRATLSPLTYDRTEIRLGLHTVAAIVCSFLLAGIIGVTMGVFLILAVQQQAALFSFKSKLNSRITAFKDRREIEQNMGQLAQLQAQEVTYESSASTWLSFYDFIPKGAEWCLKQYVANSLDSFLADKYSKHDQVHKPLATFIEEYTDFCTANTFNIMDVHVCQSILADYGLSIVEETGVDTEAFQHLVKRPASEIVTSMSSIDKERDSLQLFIERCYQTSVFDHDHVLITDFMAEYHDFVSLHHLLQQPVKLSTMKELGYPRVRARVPYITTDPEHESSNMFARVMRFLLVTVPKHSWTTGIFGFVFVLFLVSACVPLPLVAIAFFFQEQYAQSAMPLETVLTLDNVIAGPAKFTLDYSAWVIWHTSVILWLAFLWYVIALFEMLDHFLVQSRHIPPLMNHVPSTFFGHVGCYYRWTVRWLFRLLLTLNVGGAMCYFGLVAVWAVLAAIINPYKFLAYSTGTAAALATFFSRYKSATQASLHLRNRIKAAVNTARERSVAALSAFSAKHTASIQQKLAGVMPASHGPDGSSDASAASTFASAPLFRSITKERVISMASSALGVPASTIESAASGNFEAITTVCEVVGADESIVRLLVARDKSAIQDIAATVLAPALKIDQDTLQLLLEVRGSNKVSIRLRGIKALLRHAVNTNNSLSSADDGADGADASSSELVTELVPDIAGAIVELVQSNTVAELMEMLAEQDMQQHFSPLLAPELLGALNAMLTPDFHDLWAQLPVLLDSPLMRAYATRLNLTTQDSALMLQLVQLIDPLSRGNTSDALYILKETQRNNPELKLGVDHSLFGAVLACGLQQFGAGKINVGSTKDYSLRELVARPLAKTLKMRCDTTMGTLLAMSNGCSVDVELLAQQLNVPHLPAVWAVCDFVSNRISCIDSKTKILAAAFNCPPLLLQALFDIRSQRVLFVERGVDKLVSLCEFNDSEPNELRRALNILVSLHCALAPEIVEHATRLFLNCMSLSPKQEGAAASLCESRRNINYMMSEDLSDTIEALANVLSRFPSLPAVASIRKQLKNMKRSHEYKEDHFDGLDEAVDKLSSALPASFDVDIHELSLLLERLKSYYSPRYDANKTLQDLSMGGLLSDMLSTLPSSTFKASAVAATLLGTYYRTPWCGAYKRANRTRVYQHALTALTGNRFSTAAVQRFVDVLYLVCNPTQAAVTFVEGDAAASLQRTLTLEDDAQQNLSNQSLVAVAKHMQVHPRTLFNLLRVGAMSRQHHFCPQRLDAAHTLVRNLVADDIDAQKRIDKWKRKCSRALYDARYLRRCLEVFAHNCARADPSHVSSDDMNVHSCVANLFAFPAQDVDDSASTVYTLLQLLRHKDLETEVLARLLQHMPSNAAQGKGDTALLSVIEQSAPPHVLIPKLLSAYFGENPDDDVVSAVQAVVMLANPQAMFASNKTSYLSMFASHLGCKLHHLLASLALRMGQPRQIYRHLATIASRDLNLSLDLSTSLLMLAVGDTSESVLSEMFGVDDAVVDGLMSCAGLERTALFTGLHSFCELLQLNSTTFEPLVSLMCDADVALDKPATLFHVPKHQLVAVHQLFSGSRHMVRNGVHTITVDWGLDVVHVKEVSAVLCFLRGSYQPLSQLVSFTHAEMVAARFLVHFCNMPKLDEAARQLSTYVEPTDQPTSFNSSHIHNVVSVMPLTQMMMDLLAQAPHWHGMDCRQFAKLLVAYAVATVEPRLRSELLHFFPSLSAIVFTSSDTDIGFHRASRAWEDTVSVDSAQRKEAARSIKDELAHAIGHALQTDGVSLDHQPADTQGLDTAQLAVAELGKAIGAIGRSQDMIEAFQFVVSAAEALLSTTKQCCDQTVHSAATLVKAVYKGLYDVDMENVEEFVCLLLENPDAHSAHARVNDSGEAQPSLQDEVKAFEVFLTADVREYFLPLFFSSSEKYGVYTDEKRWNMLSQLLTSNQRMGRLLLALIERDGFAYRYTRSGHSAETVMDVVQAVSPTKAHLASIQYSLLSIAFGNIWETELTPLAKRLGVNYNVLSLFCISGQLSRIPSRGDPLDFVSRQAKQAMDELISTTSVIRDKATLLRLMSAAATNNPDALELVITEALGARHQPTAALLISHQVRLLTQPPCHVRKASNTTQQCYKALKAAAGHDISRATFTTLFGVFVAAMRSPALLLDSRLSRHLACLSLFGALSPPTLAMLCASASGSSRYVARAIPDESPSFVANVLLAMRAPLFVVRLKNAYAITCNDCFNTWPRARAMAHLLYLTARGECSLDELQQMYDTPEPSKYAVLMSLGLTQQQGRGFDQYGAEQATRDAQLLRRVLQLCHGDIGDPVFDDDEERDGDGDGEDGQVSAQAEFVRGLFGEEFKFDSLRIIQGYGYGEPLLAEKAGQSRDSQAMFELFGGWAAVFIGEEKKEALQFMHKLFRGAVIQDTAYVDALLECPVEELRDNPAFRHYDCSDEAAAKAREFIKRLCALVEELMSSSNQCQHSHRASDEHGDERHDDDDDDDTDGEVEIDEAHGGPMASDMREAVSALGALVGLKAPVCYALHHVFSPNLEAAKLEPLAQMLGLSSRMMKSIIALGAGDLRTASALISQLGSWNQENLTMVQQVASVMEWQGGRLKAQTQRTMEAAKLGSGIPTISATNAQEMLMAFDADNSSTIDFSEFLLLLKYLNYPRPISRHVAMEVFVQSDTDGDERLTVAELSDAVTSWNDKINGEILYQLGYDQSTLIKLLFLFVVVVVILLLFLFAGIQAFTEPGGFTATVNAIMALVTVGGAGRATAAEDKAGGEDDAEIESRLQEQPADVA
eukprot:m.80122 g.80122  ORF g.80122 m.80122 type:complete len:3343 (+) comp12593_c1_seq2:234-10262(+)